MPYHIHRESQHCQLYLTLYQIELRMIKIEQNWLRFNRYGNCKFQHNLKSNTKNLEQTVIAILKNIFQKLLSHSLMLTRANCNIFQSKMLPDELTFNASLMNITLQFICSGFRGVVAPRKLALITLSLVSLAQIRH